MSSSAENADFGASSAAFVAQESVMNSKRMSSSASGAGYIRRYPCRMRYSDHGPIAVLDAVAKFQSGADSGPVIRVRFVRFHSVLFRIFRNSYAP